MIIMEVVNMIDTKNMNLNELSTATRENLESLGYGLRTIQMVNSIWKDLSQFLGSRSEISFQPVYGLEYLHERIGYPECLYRKLTPNERDYIRAVRMLTSFQETGTIPEALTRNRDNWSEPVKEIRDVYIRYCEEVFKTHATQRSRIAAADRFMRIVIVNKGVVWEDISAKIISEYAMSLAEYAKATVEVHLRGLRYFLHFLYLSNPAKVILYGKGRKLREVPILPNTALHLQQYLTENKLSLPEKLDRTLFVNRQGNPLTRAGATYILDKYVQMAELDTHVSPHILRHTKAMHLLEAGINIFYIKDLLGHEDISTTEVYAKASIETQRRALEKHSLVMPPATPSWVTNTDTLEWLKALGK